MPVTLPPASSHVARVAESSRRPARRPPSGVSPLHIGDPHFATPQFIQTAMTRALGQGYTHYCDPQGDPELREALANEMSARSSTGYSSDQMIVTAGGSPAIASSILATVSPGDRVVIPEPSYSLYGDSIRLAGGQATFVPPSADMHLDLDRLADASVGARMIIVCQPCNPTGVVYRKDELAAIAEIAARNDALVLSDEAYDHIIFDDVEWSSALSIDGLCERLLYCQTYSKTWAMTGWRVGYVAAPSQLARSVALIHRTLNGPVNAAVQRAALAATRASNEWPDLRRQDYQRRRDLVVAAIAKSPALILRPPEGTFYAFPRLHPAIPSEDFVRHALEHGVGLRAGIEFGAAGEGHFRLAFCVEDDALVAGLDRLDESLRTLA